MKKIIIATLMLFLMTTASYQNAMSQAPQKGYAPVNGLNMYYEIHGEGEPILLLHGSFMTIDLNWGQLIPELAKTRKVIAVEMQGHGRTADIDRAFSYQALASDVAELIKYLEIDSADILGYSLGGTVAFQLAIQNPALVKKLILLSTVYKFDGWLPEVTAQIKSFTPTVFDNTPLITAYQKISPDPSYWHTFIEKMIRFETQHFDLGIEHIKSIQSPTLLVMGDNDGVQLSHITDMYQSLGGGVFGDMAGLPASQLAILPGKTHVSLMMDTEKIVSTILPFLDESTAFTQH
jgi:pimeloyl-ACP methyl ester carboxylesterase